MKICIYGAGAIGGYLGVQLLRAGADVSLVARGAHLTAMRERGLKEAKGTLIILGITQTALNAKSWISAASFQNTNRVLIANAVKGVNGQTVTVTYKGGEKKIEIPADVPVVALVPATKEEIKPGAIVFVPTQRQADDSLNGGAVLFGKDGLIPPM